MARLGRRVPNKPIIITGHPLGNPAVPTPAHGPIIRMVSKTRQVMASGRLFFSHNRPLGNPAVPTPTTSQPHVHLTNARKAGRIILTHNTPLGNPAQATVHALHLVSSNARRGTGRIILTHGLMAAVAAPAVAAHQPIVHQTNARRPGHVIVLRSSQLGNPAQPTPVTPNPIVHQTNARRAGVIQVHRSPPRVTPAGGPPVTGFIAWYDASRITGQADNTPLSSWPDLSPSGFDLAQPSGANQPTYYSSTTGKTVNSLPAVWFDGANGWMQSSAVNPALAAPFTIFMVTATTVVAAAGSLGFCGGGGAVPQVGGHNTPPTFFGYDGQVLDGPRADPNLHCFTAVLNGASGSFTVDANTFNGNTLSNGLGRFIFSGTSTHAALWTGPICEVIVYQSALSVPNQQSVQAYLTTKWFGPAIATTPEPLVRQTNARRAGRVIVTQPKQVPVVVVTTTPQPLVHQTNARRAGRIIVTSSSYKQIASGQPQVHLTNRRPVARTIVLRTPGAIGNPAQPTPGPHVITKTRRQAGRIILTRPVGVLGVAAFTPPHPPPLVVTTSRRQAGRIFVKRTGPIGVPAQPTPQPIVITKTRRGAGKVLVVVPFRVPGTRPLAPPTPIEFTAGEPHPYWVAGEPRSWWRTSDPAPVDWVAGQPTTAWRSSQAVFEPLDADNAGPDWQTGEPRT